MFVLRRRYAAGTYYIRAIKGLVFVSLGLARQPSWSRSEPETLIRPARAFNELKQCPGPREKPGGLQLSLTVRWRGRTPRIGSSHRGCEALRRRAGWGRLWRCIAASAFRGPGNYNSKFKQTLRSSIRTLLNNLANHLQLTAMPAVALVGLASAQVEVVLELLYCG